MPAECACCGRWFVLALRLGEEVSAAGRQQNHNRDDRFPHESPQSLISLPCYYFLVRSFSNPFNSDMNSWTSLKSMYTEAKRT